jgi:hypothetical protein
MGLPAMSNSRNREDIITNLETANINPKITKTINYIGRKNYKIWQKDTIWELN